MSETETRVLTVRVGGVGYPQEVSVIRRDKRGLLVEVPAGVWLPWKGKYRSTGDRFYVTPSQAKKVAK